MLGVVVTTPQWWPGRLNCQSDGSPVSGFGSLSGLSGAQLKGPRLGDHHVLNDRRPIHVVGVARPQLLAALGIQHHQPALAEFARQKLLPIVPVGIRAADQQVAVLVHEGQIAAARADVRAIGDVDGFPPDFLARFRIERHGRAHVELFQLLLFLLRLVRRQVFEGRFILPQAGPRALLATACSRRRTSGRRQS